MKDILGKLLGALIRMMLTLLLGCLKLTGILIEVLCEWLENLITKLSNK